MGFYDGVGGMTAPTPAPGMWRDTLDLPVLLVVRPAGRQPDAWRPRCRACCASARPATSRAFCSTTAAPMLAQMPGTHAGRRRRACRCWAFCPTCRRPRSRAAIWACTRPGRSTALRRRIDAAGRSCRSKTSIWTDCLASATPPARTGSTRTTRQDTTASVPHRRGAGRGVLLCLRRNAGCPAARRGGACALSARCGTRHCREDAGGLYLPGGYPELYAEAPGRRTPPCARAVRAGCGGGPAHRGRVRRLSVPRPEHWKTPTARAFPMAGALPGQRRHGRAGWSALATRSLTAPARTACCSGPGNSSPCTSSTTGIPRKMARPSPPRKADWTGSGRCGFATPSVSMRGSRICTAAGYAGPGRSGSWRAAESYQNKRGSE